MTDTHPVPDLCQLCNTEVRDLPDGTVAHVNPIGPDCPPAPASPALPEPPALRYKAFCETCNGGLAQTRTGAWLHVGGHPADHQPVVRVAPALPVEGDDSEAVVLARNAYEMAVEAIERGPDVDTDRAWHALTDDVRATWVALDAAIRADERRVTEARIAELVESLRRWVLDEQVGGREELEREFGPPVSPGSSISEEAWMDRVLREPSMRALRAASTPQQGVGKCKT